MIDIAIYLSLMYAFLYHWKIISVNNVSQIRLEIVWWFSALYVCPFGYCSTHVLSYLPICSSALIIFIAMTDFLQTYTHGILHICL